MRKILAVFLCFMMLGSTIYAKLIPNGGSDLLKFTDLDENPNIGYSVGLMYYDVWRYNNGSWTSDGKPGERHSANYTYRFQFASDKKVKNAKVYTFNPNNSKDMSIWNDVRGGNYDKEYKKRVGSNIQVTKASPTGLGTNKINIDVTTDVTLVASEPEILPPKPYQGQNVVGLRYYIPIIIEVEFEPSSNLMFKGCNANASGAINSFDSLTPNDLKNGDEFFIEWGPHDVYTEIYVYFIPDWIKVVTWDEKKVKSTPPTEIIRLQPGQTVSRTYKFTGNQYSGYDKSSLGVGYATFQATSKSYTGISYSNVFEEFSISD